MPGMAPSHPASCKPQALHNAMALQGFDGILRTTRIKAAATAKEGADAILIDTNKQNPRHCPETTHRGNPARSPSISARQTPHRLRSIGPALAAGFDNLTTRSRAGNFGLIVRKASRINRLSKFRSTARRARLLGITKPKRAVEPPFRRNRSSKRSPRRRVVLALTAANSDGRRSRCSGRKSLPSVTCCGSNAQPLPAFGTPGTDDGTAATGTHAHQETVGTLTPHNRRLICPFHGVSLSRETRDYSVRWGFCQAHFSPTPCG